MNNVNNMNDVVIKKAGAIVLRDGINGREILLLYRNKQKDWGFPKGHVEKGETVQEATIREIKEETGLDIKVLNELSHLRYALPSGDEAELLMFLATPLSTDQKLIKENATDDLRWIPISEAENLLSYQNLKDYFKTIYIKLKLPLH